MQVYEIIFVEGIQISNCQQEKSYTGLDLVEKTKTLALLMTQWQLSRKKDSKKVFLKFSCQITVSREYQRKFLTLQFNGEIKQQTDS